MAIHIHNITKRFGTLRANDAISVSFAAGHIHGVVGENGAGKSTLMKIIAGYQAYDDGSIHLNNKPVRCASPRDALKAGIGMVYQEPLDVPAFTALENFACASPRSTMPSLAHARTQLVQLAHQFGFTLNPDAVTANLTIGQRQQLDIIRLLAWGVQVLILDEPTTGITASQKTTLFAALRRLASEGKTVLFVSHKLEEIDELCHTATVLRGGKIAGEGQLTLPQPRDHVLALMFGDAHHTTPTTPFRVPVQSFVPSMPTPVWQLKHVTLQAGAITITNLSLNIHAGKIIGLAGLAGSGQQLLLRTLAGMYIPQEGQVLLNGYDMSKRTSADFRVEGVHLVPADRLQEGIIGGFSLADHIALMQRTSWLLPKRRAVQRDAQQAIDDYTIRAEPHTPLAYLSGGNQQRAMLALLPERCTGLLLEQPTRGLDVTSASGVWQRLQTRCADGMALVFASADLDELLAYSDEVLVFCGGRVSPLLHRAELDTHRLAELIGGVGFATYNETKPIAR